MKHTLKITIVLLAMFLITQFIGLAVIYSYSPKNQEVLINGTLTNVTITPELPYGMQPPEMTTGASLTSILISFAIAIFLIFLLMRIRAAIFLRFWFFAVVIIALGITFNSVLMHLPYSMYISLIIALPLAFFKIFKRNIAVHNLTELLIYPGIAAVFVPILGLWAIIILLIIISIYDIYAVWHAGFMQKMAKYQINQVGVFGGFFIPYFSKKQRKEMELIRQKYKNKIPSRIKNKKIKVNLAILGGGDIVFPLIFAGVVFQALGLLPALIISVFATLALFLLQVFAKKGKFYPAMPFLTAGCFLGLAVAYLISLL